MYRRFINKSKFKYITDHSGGGGVAACILSVCRRCCLAGLFSMCELVGLRIPLSLSISFSALQVSRRLSYSVLRRVIRIEISLNALRTKDVILGVWAKATRTTQNQKVLLEILLHPCSIFFRMLNLALSWPALGVAFVFEAYSNLILNCSFNLEMKRLFNLVYISN